MDQQRIVPGVGGEGDRSPVFVRVIGDETPVVPLNFPVEIGSRYGAGAYAPQHVQRPDRQEPDFERANRRSFREAVRLERPFDVDAKIDEPPQAQDVQAFEVGRRQVGQAVGAEQPPPSRAPAAAGRIAAEVAKVGRALECEAPFIGRSHKRSHQWGGRIRTPCAAALTNA